MLKTNCERLFWVFLSIFLSFGQLTWAQVLGQSSGGRAMALGGMQAVLADEWAAMGNQAGLAYVDSLAVGAFLDNRYGLQQFNRTGMLLVLPVRGLGSFALAGAVYGYSLYYESLLGVAYARQLIPERLAIGLKLNHYRLLIADNNGSLQTATGEIGLLLHPLRQLAVGLHLDNPFPQEFSEQPDLRLPSRLRVGLGYHIGQVALLAIEADKQLEHPKTNWKAAAEITLARRFALRGGVATWPAQQSFGLGLWWRGFRWDVAFARHHTLGYSPHISLLYRP